MTKKPSPDLWYQRRIDAHTPKKHFFRNALIAFCGGGLFCAAAQLILYLLTDSGLSQEDAFSWVIFGVIFLTALFTGLGLYDKAGQKLGAALAVPISGFANSVASAMLEHKSEGLVLGSGCNSFKLAGAVIIFGIVSACAAAIIGLLPCFA